MASPAPLSTNLSTTSHRSTFPPSLEPEPDTVESPSLSTSNALARYEVEPNHTRSGGGGTKILMVEWEDDEGTRGLRGEWRVGWEGKGRETILAALGNEQVDGEGEEEGGQEGDGDGRDGEDRLLPPGTAKPADTNTSQPAADTTKRLYFLLTPSQPVPPTVHITFHPHPTNPQINLSTTVFRTNPLPAIFPPQLLAQSSAQGGKKGVLHTIWAKKRLQTLSREIEREARVNGEGVGLSMALREREWIEGEFGVALKGRGEKGVAEGGQGQGQQGPRSPGGGASGAGGGRLMEKLRGLKLGTSGRELSPAPRGNPLSPEMADVAVSSFAAIKGTHPDGQSQSETQAQPQSSQAGQLPPTTAPRRIAAQSPPPEILAQQQQQQVQRKGMTSLGAALDGDTRPQEPAVRESTAAEEKEEDLFALPISPRSPDMAKSPFSFGREDTMKYVKDRQVAQ